MAQVEWTPLARDDLDSIVEYISRDNPIYAPIYGQKILDKARMLERFPKIGRVVPEFGDPQVREIFLGNYRIIYRVKKSVVQVLTIYHAARLLDPESKARLLDGAEPAS